MQEGQLTRMSTASACGFAPRPSESASLMSGVSHRTRGVFGTLAGGFAELLQAPTHPPHCVWPATITKGCQGYDYIGSSGAPCSTPRCSTAYVSTERAESSLGWNWLQRRVLDRGSRPKATRNDEGHTLQYSCGRRGRLALQRRLRSRAHDCLRSQSTRPLGFGLWRRFRKSWARLGRQRFSTRRWQPGVSKARDIGKPSSTVVVVEAVEVVEDQLWMRKNATVRDRGRGKSGSRAHAHAFACSAPRPSLPCLLISTATKPTKPTTATMALAFFAVEKAVAVSAVVRACDITSRVFNQLVRGETLTKDDKSPVTSQSVFQTLRLAASLMVVS